MPGNALVIVLFLVGAAYGAQAAETVSSKTNEYLAEAWDSNAYVCLMALDLYTRDGAEDLPADGLEMVSVCDGASPARLQFYNKSQPQMKQLLATAASQAARGQIAAQCGLVDRTIRTWFLNDLDHLGLVNDELALNPYRALFMLLYWELKGTPLDGADQPAPFPEPNDPAALPAVATRLRIMEAFRACFGADQMTFTSLLTKRFQ